MINKRHPIIAIVGKPNVGKSTFFNKLIGQSISITSEIAGTTRDRVIANIDWLNKTFTFVDTAGLEEVDKISSSISIDMNKQVNEALKEADMVLFLVDGKEALDKSDLIVAEKLRKSQKPVLLLVNKAESEHVRKGLADFYKVGLGKPYAVSSIHGTGIAEVLDEVVRVFKDDSKYTFDKAEEKIPKVSLIGRPNVGKSTLLNYLTNSERSIVSDIPGTTRDSVSSKVNFNGREFVLIDTAGIRKSGKIERGVEKYSVIRTLRSIDESDVVVIVVDGQEGFVRGDVHLITQALESGKPVILGINKTDVASIEGINLHRFSFIRKLDYTYISAKTGTGIKDLLELVFQKLEGTSTSYFEDK